jgi:hypothetical protein
MKENKQEQKLLFGCFIGIFLYTCLMSLGMGLTNGIMEIITLFDNSESYTKYLRLTTGSGMDLFRSQLNLVYAIVFIFLIAFKYYALGRPYKTAYLQLTSKSILLCLITYSVGKIVTDVNPEKTETILTATYIIYALIILLTLFCANKFFHDEMSVNKGFLKLAVSFVVIVALIIATEQQIENDKINKRQELSASLCGYPSYDKISGALGIEVTEVVVNDYIEKLDSLGEINYFKNNYEKFTNEELIGLKKEFLNYYTANKSDYMQTKYPEEYKKSILEIRRTITEGQLSRDIATINAFDKGGINAVAELINNQTEGLTNLQQILILKNKDSVKFNKDHGLLITKCD